MIQKLHCHCAQEVGLCVGYVKVYSCKIKSNLLCSKPEDGKHTSLTVACCITNISTKYSGRVILEILDAERGYITGHFW